MNAADLATVLTFFGCPLAAGAVALSHKAGWFAVLFVAGGFALGYVFAAGVRKLAYGILDAGVRQSTDHSSRVTRVMLSLSLMVAYTFIPALVGVGAMMVTGWLVSVILMYTR